MNIFRYVYDDKFNLVQTIAIKETDSYPVQSTTITPPNTTENVVFKGDRWEVEPFIEKVTIPASVTKRQARQQLILMGLIQNVQPLIDSIPDDTERAMIQSFWDDSTEYERNRVELITLATGLGLDSDALDTAFVEANKL